MRCCHPQNWSRALTSLPKSVHFVKNASGTSSRGLVNDLTWALGQQMFYWGRDVLAAGNLLLQAGFCKRPSPGLQGTSCYACAWRGGLIELHGSCAGWYPADESQTGFLFIRSDRRCYAHHRTQPVVPGRYDYKGLVSGQADMLLPASRLFVEWLVDYERQIPSMAGTAHREACHALFARLSTSRPWLRPEPGLRWLARYADGDPSLPRCRRLL